jgi:RHH-type proline utilization regulon transcriptional repressor/proline dehydrogenase/delta 1-pyrroline-5-carboxylate dehydrogenase
MALFTRGKPPAPQAPADPPGPTDDASLEAAIHRIGGEILERAYKHRTGVLSAAFWSDKLMDWAMKDEAFKVQLFRFVDAFPRLMTPEQVHDHLVDYLGQPGVTLPPGLGVGLKAGGLLKGTMTKTITSRISSMAEKFIAGTDAASAAPTLRKLRQRGIAFSVDLLGEGCVSAEEAEADREQYLKLVKALPDHVRDWPEDERLDRDHVGPIPRANVSIKITALMAQIDPIVTDRAVDALTETLTPILEAAREHDVLINFDMEQHELKELTLQLFMRCCEAIDFPAGLAMQAYLRSGDDDARRIIQWARNAGRQVTVRLVKGAYWDYETINAEALGWPIPVWSRKSDTDACCERMTQRFIESMPRSVGEGGVKLALGSHNARTIAAALAMIDRHDLPRSALELQMLHGMADQLKLATADMGLRVREYVPVGAMIPGMAYLVRRLLENTSNESWLRAGFHDKGSPEELLASPHDHHEDPDPGLERIARGPERHALAPAVEGVGDGRPFLNEPPRDFARRTVREQFARAVESATAPPAPDDATVESARQTVALAHDALPAWRATPVRERAAIIARAGAIMRERRDELCGMLIRTVGKTWREADAEVCEAIDFCEYSARQAVGLFEGRRLGRYVGELDELVHEPRGVAVVLGPWNFPLSITCGMATAALATGNPTVIKPACRARGVGRIVHDILLEAGCPADAVHLAAGPGATIGRALVADDRTALIVYSGPRRTGLEIIEAAGRTAPGQLHVKKVLAAMGGKNATIVDASADLEEAVIGVRGAAFGFQGQKTSACSRAIVVESLYDTFVERLCASVRGMRLGDPADPGVSIGPVIDEGAANAINELIEIGKGEATLALALSMPDSSELLAGAHYVPPHVFTDVAPDARIANEEIFGPVLAITKVGTFEDAIDLANRTTFSLTGSIYSRKPSNIELGRASFRVGNLFINRPCTGALVGRQPFGGLGLSGTGTIAGGPDALLHYVQSRSISENTMRRGFAPEL